MGNQELHFEIENRAQLASGKWANPDYVAKKYPYEPGCIWLGRNPHNYEQMIGARTETHVFVCAESGGGKGRAFMVNNQVLWPGSLIAVGPKGDEATMAAVRRAQGSDQCDGLGQDVYVLDPMGFSNIPDEYLAYYDLLEGLKADDTNLARKCARIATAICKISDSTGDSADWNKRGRELLARIIQHVVSFPIYEPEERNLLTVRNLAMNGDEAQAEAAYQSILKKAEAAAIDAGEEFDPKSVSRPNAFEMLLRQMSKNQAGGGGIARVAKDLLESKRGNVRLYDSVRKSAADHMLWLDGTDIESVVCKREGGPTKTFNAGDIKNKKMSIFVCLPEKDYDTLDTWLRGVIVSLIQSMTETQGLGENGERVLFCIDEFANLGPMPAIADAVNSIRSAGVSLMIATQGLVRLQESYPKSWERFPAASGIEVYFAAQEKTVGEFLEKKLGEKEIVKYERSISKNSGTSISEALATAYSYTDSLAAAKGTSKTGSVADGVSTQESRGGGSGESVNQGHSTHVNYNTSTGYGPGVFHIVDLEHTLQQGSGGGRGSNDGSSKQKSKQWSKARSENRTVQQGEGTSETETSTHAETHSETETLTKGSSEGESATVSERFHKTPLLSVAEAKKTLIAPKDPAHPSFPGMAVVLLDDEEDPFFVRKCNYDQDPFFVRKFSPNPSFEFLPLSKQPLFGWQITPEHFYKVKVPPALANEKFELRPAAREGKVIKKRKPFLLSSQPGPRLEKETFDTDFDECEAPFGLAIVEQFNPDVAADNEVMLVRGNKPFTDKRRAALDAAIWGPHLDYIAKREHIAKVAAKSEEEEKNRVKAHEEEKEYMGALYSRLRDDVMYKRMRPFELLLKAAYGAAILGTVLYIISFTTNRDFGPWLSFFSAFGLWVVAWKIVHNEIYKPQKEKALSLFVEAWGILKKQENKTVTPEELKAIEEYYYPLP